MICARCNESGAKETGKKTDMTEVGHLPREKDEEVYLDRHLEGDTEVGPDQDPHRNFQL